MILTEEHLLGLGFTKHESLIINSYSKNISFYPDYEFKELSVTLQQGNQYVHIKFGDPEVDRRNDDIVTIFNGDNRGVLTREYIEDLLRLLTEKI